VSISMVLGSSVAVSRAIASAWVTTHIWRCVQRGGEEAGVRATSGDQAKHDITVWLPIRPVSGVHRAWGGCGGGGCNRPKLDSCRAKGQQVVMKSPCCHAREGARV